MHIRTIFIIFSIFILVFAKSDAYFYSENSNKDLCAFSSSSCTMEEQMQMKTKSVDQLTQKLQDRIITLRQFLHTQLTTLKDFFVKSIRNSHLDLDLMFSNTYGAFYKENVEILNEFFNRINSFTSSYSEASMNVIVDSFFDKLFRVMFKITNPFYSISEQKWQCMEKFYREISAFEDIPQRVANQLTHPLTNWRHFMAAVETVHNILDGYLNITLKEECQRRLTEMETCAVCQGIVERPCRPYCINVLSGCTYQMLESETTWRLTADTLIKLANQLNNRQNLISSIQPVPVLISEAIMHFQEKKDYITNKMIGKCLYEETELFFRAKRSTSLEDDFPRIRKPHGTSKQSKDKLILDQIFNSFIQKMEDFKLFFKSIPESLCESDQWGTNELEYCWNGTSIGRYRFPMVNTSVPFQNPEYQHENFLTFRGNYVEERLRLQWLQSRLANILSTGFDSKNEEKSAAEPYIGTDDEDYAEDDYEGSAEYFATSSSEKRRSSNYRSFEKVEIVIEPYPVRMGSHSISIILVFLIPVIFNLLIL